MDNRFLYGVGALVAVCAGIKLTSKESFDAETFNAEDAFKGMRKGSTKIIEGFDVKKIDKYNYRITDETLKDGSFVVIMSQTRIIPYETRHDMEGYNWKEGWKFSEASFNYGVLGGGYYSYPNLPPMKKWDRSMSYGFNTQMEALKFLKKAYDNGDFEDGYLIFDAETFDAEEFLPNGVLRYYGKTVKEGQEGMFKGGEIKIIKIQESEIHGVPSVIIYEYLDEKGNPLEIEGRFGMKTRDFAEVKDFMINFTPFEPVNPIEYGAETFEADTVLNQESFDKLMGQLDRMTYNELYMIRHQTQLRLRELDNNLHY